MFKFLLFYVYYYFFFFFWTRSLQNSGDGKNSINNKKQTFFFSFSIFLPNPFLIPRFFPTTFTISIGVNIFCSITSPAIFYLQFALLNNPFFNLLFVHASMPPMFSISSIIDILQLSLYFCILSRYIPSFNQSKPTWSL